MIMAKEQAFLKAQEQFEQLKDLVEAAARDGHRIDTVERDLMGHLLGLGRTLLTAFVAQQGDTAQARLGKDVEDPIQGTSGYQRPRHSPRLYGA